MKRLLVTLTIVVLLLGCTGTSSMEIINARVWVPTGSTTAGFFDIVNSGAAPDTLVGVEADVADVSLHETIVDGDVIGMQPVEQVDVPAHTTVRFEPGGLHVMLTDVAPLDIGDVVELRLRFLTSGTITLQVPVTEIEVP